MKYLFIFLITFSTGSLFASNCDLDMKPDFGGMYSIKNSDKVLFPSNGSLKKTLNAYKELIDAGTCEVFKSKCDLDIKPDYGGMYSLKSGDKTLALSNGSLEKTLEFYKQYIDMGICEVSKSKCDLDIKPDYGGMYSLKSGDKDLALRNGSLEKTLQIYKQYIDMGICEVSRSKCDLDSRPDFGGMYSIKSGDNILALRNGSLEKTLKIYNQYVDIGICESGAKFSSQLANYAGKTTKTTVTLVKKISIDCEDESTNPKTPFKIIGTDHNGAVVAEGHKDQMLVRLIFDNNKPNLGRTIEVVINGETNRLSLNPGLGPIGFKSNFAMRMLLKAIGINSDIKINCSPLSQTVIPEPALEVIPTKIVDDSSRNNKKVSEDMEPAIKNESATSSAVSK